MTLIKIINTVVFNNTVFMTKQTFQDLQRGIKNEQA